MNGSSLFTELSLVVALGAGIAAIMHRFKQPLIIGHILTGLIAGPTVLNVIHDDTAFGVFGNIGVALLLFIIGLELNVKVFSKLGKVVFSTTAVEVGLITIIGALGSRVLMGFGVMESLIVGLSLALSSTIIIVKILNDKKETSRLYAQVAIGILIIQDIVATAGRIFISAQSGEGASFGSILFLLIRGLVVSGGLYWAGKKLLPKLTTQMEHSRELMLLVSLAWGLGFATLFEHAGFSIELGALFAGASMATLPFSGEVSSRLKPLRDFFIVIFFVSLGHSMIPGQMFAVIVPAIFLSLIVVVIKPIIVMGSMGMSGYTKRASFKTAIALSQISEFSLVFIFSAFDNNLVSEKARVVITLVALITFTSSTYMMKYDDELFKLVENRLKIFERKVTTQEQRHPAVHYPVVMLGYRKGGAEFVKTFKKMKRKFIVVDYDPEVIEMLDRQNLDLMYGDVTDADILDEINLKDSKLVVSTISDHHINLTLVNWLSTHNEKAVFICSADSAEGAMELYSKGASYVIMPHLIGSEKMGSFLQKNALSKTEFKRFREKHLKQIEKYYAQIASDDDSSGLNP